MIHEMAPRDRSVNFTQHRPAIIQGIQYALERANPLLQSSYPKADLSKMISYHFGFDEEKHDTGKLLRPTLLILASQAMGIESKKVIPAAAAIEILHNTSLIYDDIQDGDNFRRGRRTVWNKYGMAQGITVGIASHTLAFSALDGLAETGYSPEEISQVRHVFQEAMFRLASGQAKDIAFEKMTDITLSDYLEMIGGKTASLIQASLVIGAMLGGADHPTIRAFDTFGENLGYMFQIQDDVLGIWGNEDETGKPVGADIRKRKKSLPVVLAMQLAEKPDARRLRILYTQERDLTRFEIAEVMEIFERAGVREAAERMQNEYLQRTNHALSATGISQSRLENLTGLAQLLTSRRK